MSKTTWYVIIFLLVLVVLVVAVKTFMKQLLNMPLEGKITSPFGPRNAPVAGASTFHNGIDIAPKSATSQVKSPYDGIVWKIFSTTNGGNSLIIRHEVAPNQYWYTGYAHLKSYAPGLKQGDKVTQGQFIAMPGNTGIGTGVHLHFTLTNPKGVKVDPLLYIGKPLVSLA